ncbi:MAG: FeoA family protein [bacterium]|nr:FeoA family protein [bacterium]
MEEFEVSLSDMKADQSGVVAKLHGGQAMVSKLATLGVRVGEEIKKISQQIMRGPVLIKVGKGQVAIGHGMARKITIKIKEKKIQK